MLNLKKKSHSSKEIASTNPNALGKLEREGPVFEQSSINIDYLLLILALQLCILYAVRIV